MPVMGGNRSDIGLVVALLGPVEVGPAGGAPAPVAQPRLRVLLGLLGVVDGRVVTAEALVDGLWEEEWSRGRERNLHALVYQLRRRLATLEPDKGATRLARAGAGCRLVLAPGELDVAVFRDLAGQGREAARAGDAARARDLFGQALGLWRGAALADAAPLCPRLAGEAARLEEARLAVTEERIGCDLAGVAVTLGSALPMVVAGVAMITVGFFATHGVASGWAAAVGQRRHHAASEASACYLLAYYIGSSVFGVAGTALWASGRWPAVAVMAAILLLIPAALGGGEARASQAACSCSACS